MSTGSLIIKGLCDGVRMSLDTRVGGLNVNRETSAYLIVVLVWLGSGTVRACPRPCEGTQVLISMFTSGSVCFLQGSAR